MIGVDEASRSPLRRRLLAVGMNALGDGLFTTPALSLLRQRLPVTVPIDVQAGALAGAVHKTDPGIAHVAVRPRRHGWPRHRALVDLLRQGRHDGVILFHSNFSYALIARLMRVPVRVGFDVNGCGPLLTHRVVPHRPGEHLAAAYLRLADALVPPIDGPPLDARYRFYRGLGPTTPLPSFMDHVTAGSTVIGCAIGGTRPQNRWPVEAWAGFVRRARTAGWVPVLLGTPGDSALAEQILARLPHSTTDAPGGEPFAINAVGITPDIPTLAEVLARCDALVSGDTGTMHLAVAIRTPVLALFGSTDPKESGPWLGGVTPSVDRGVLILNEGMSCGPCHKHPTCDGRHDCMVRLTPDRVEEGVRHLLRITRLARPTEGRGHAAAELLPMAS